MATLYITEFQNTEQVGSAMPQDPPVAEQTVAISGASTQSSAFNGKTRLIRLHTDSNCSIQIGPNPTATSTTGRMAANSTELRGVPEGGSLRIAVITNT